ncbi:hypothetical protein KR059_001231, partial [Drosophila kikkawai]
QTSPIATRIAGGELATRGMFPHQVALVIQHSAGALIQCGGSLITKQFVLTAAHCLVDAIGAKIYSGATRFADVKDAEEEFLVSHKNFIIYPGYLGFGGYNDLALIQLPRKALTSDSVQPIELAGEFMNQKFLEGQPVTLTGWGSLGDLKEDTPREDTPLLYFLDVEVLDQERCVCHFLPGLVSQRRHLCTDGKFNRGACNGDSGGPLVLHWHNVSYLIGVTSFGSAGGCELGAPTSVTVYLGATVRTSPEVSHTVSSSSIIIHSGWNSANLRNDISLIKIPSTTYTTKIKAVALPAIASSYSTYAGETVIASGWGRQSDSSSGVATNLAYAEMTVIANSVCAATYGTSIVVSSNICVSTTGGISTCNGDSGGPLVTKSTIQVGLTSFGAAAGCEKGYPAAFTRVTSYLDWIKTKTGI